MTPIEPLAAGPDHRHPPASRVPELLAPGPIRIAIVGLTWDFFAVSTDVDLAALQHSLLDELADQLKHDADICFRAQLSAIPGERVRQGFHDARPDAVIVMSTMAAPTPPVTQLLAQAPEIPVVALALRTGRARPGPDYTHSDIVTDGGTVGTPQLTSVLLRNGHRVVPVLGDLTDPLPIRRAVMAAGTAGRVRHSRIGRLGGILTGYESVDVDVAALESELGLTVVDIPAAEFRDVFRSQQARDVEAEMWRLSGQYRVQLPAETLEATSRSVLSLAEIVDRYELDAGAFNCHVPEIRLRDLGFAQCVALGESTSFGIPWTCTGDMLGAIAMLVTKRLSGVALYHEFEHYAAAEDCFVIANSGEHDAAFGSAHETPIMDLNPWWPSGASVQTTPPPGPATAVGFAWLGAERGSRIVAASGTFHPSPYRRTGTTHAAFRFDDPAGLGQQARWQRWCRAGVNHHSALTRGAFADGAATVAELLGIDATIV